MADRENLSVLEEQVRELKEAVSARDAFISVAAHELRNPMTPLRGQVELLLKRVKDGRCSHEQVVTGLERIEWLIDQYMRRASTLLDVSRITSGKLSLTLQPFPLAPLIADVITNFTPLAERAGSTISFSPSDVVSVCDALAVEQIVDNLLSNAIKYGGGQPITLSTHASADTAVIEVRDGGSGISSADQKRIFERFERAVGSGDHAGGFGVGLWIVRQLAEAMKGSIAVESPETGGTIFTVKLPLAATT